MANPRGLARRRALAIVLSGAAVGAWTPCAGVAAAPACPASLDVAETPGPVPAGFRAFVNGDPPAAPDGRATPHRLDSISFSDGPPTDIAWLAPTAGGRSAQRWDFAPGPGAAIWLSCGYLATRVIVSIPLPATIRSCRVAYDAATSPPTASGLACR